MIMCHQCMERLSAYIDKQMTADEIKAMDEHIKQCESCSYELELLKAIVSVCGDIAEELPEGFEASLHRRLEAVNEEHQTKQINVFKWRQISQIAAGFVIVVTIGLFVRFGMFNSMKSVQEADRAPENVQMAGENATRAMSAKGENSNTMMQVAPSVTIARALDGVGKQDETESVSDDEGSKMFSVAITELTDALKKEEGQDTQIRIIVDDAVKALDSVRAIDEQFGGPEKNQSVLNGTLSDFGETQEEPIKLELFYDNDDIWHSVLYELQTVFPDSIIELVPAEEEKEHKHIRIIISEQH